jgi:UDP-arabinose 4-epimerase
MMVLPFLLNTIIFSCGWAGEVMGLRMGRVLVTGGAGYVGSHTCKRLARSGHDILVFDNLSRGHRHLAKWGTLVEGDLNEHDKLRDVLRQFKPEVVFHFAALAYVGESVHEPYLYYANNVAGTLSLLGAMRETGIGRIILSSSCATYGRPAEAFITEETVQRPVNPYGVSKLMCEQLCRDFDHAYGIKYVALRYFNACGADLEGEIGELHDPEPHVIPRALMAAAGQIDGFDIFGTDYETPDGTCIRDFVHVDDLADAHIAADRYLAEGGASDAFNLGTGKGTSVREIIAAVERVTGQKVRERAGPRREGDPPVLVADPAKTKRILSWTPRYSDLETILTTAWKWHCAEITNLEQAS